MTAIAAYHRVAIEAPDGAAALELERRLANLEPTTISYHGTWVVDVPAVVDTDEIDAAVQRWLADVGASSSIVLVDGTTHVVKARRRHRAANADFIG